MATRICGICKRGIRDGDMHAAVRVQPTDFTAGHLATVKLSAAPQAGLYHACPECVELAKPAIVARVNNDHGTAFTVETLPQNFLL